MTIARLDIADANSAARKIGLVQLIGDVKSEAPRVFVSLLLLVFVRLTGLEMLRQCRHHSPHNPA